MVPRTMIRLQGVSACRRHAGGRLICLLDREESNGCASWRIRPFPFFGRVVEVYRWRFAMGARHGSSNFEEDPNMGSNLKCHEFVEGWRARLLAI